jgi:ABC-type branched-subunit amino acid transport system substrate-binding protein
MPQVGRTRASGTSAAKPGTPLEGDPHMNRRGLLVAIAALAASVSVVAAQEPIVFGVITPLSPPGETSLGQQVKRGSEIAVEYLNEKGGVLGRKVVLSIQDSSGKNEAGVAAYRRLVTNDKAVAVFGFIHSGVNIAVNEVAKEIGIPTMGTQTGASDVTAKHYDVAFRTMRSIRRAPPLGSAGPKRTALNACRWWRRLPTMASAWSKRRKRRTRA